MLRDLSRPPVLTLYDSSLNFAFASATVHGWVLIRVFPQTPWIMVIYYGHTDLAAFDALLYIRVRGFDEPA
jgi:hypothetical protein